MALTSLEKCVLKTLAYYQALGATPLSVAEVRKYLFTNEGVKNEAPFFDIYNSLYKLQEQGFIKGKNGFWTLAEASQGPLEDKKPTNIGILRVEQIKHAALKWRRLNRIGFFLPYIPYVRSLSITGSVALLNSDKDSDIDVLSENKKNRIWTTRFLITVISFLLGSRKRPSRRSGKLCFSQHKSENITTFGPPNVHNIVKSMHIKIWGKDQNHKNKSVFYLKPNPIGLLLKRATEIILDMSGIGALIEKGLAKLQIL
ncbi:MAG: hypothetical protein R3251_01925, partial [Candidatus Spechtbacterales bacterium]|nr:hypothetical protein [Candidatus Spechtbacterales bacterium]